jgi:hypothetical protein
MSVTWYPYGAPYAGKGKAKKAHDGSDGKPLQYTRAHLEFSVGIFDTKLNAWVEGNAHMFSTWSVRSRCRCV